MGRFEIWGRMVNEMVGKSKCVWVMGEVVALVCASGVFP